MANHAALIRAENNGLPVTRRGRGYIEFDAGGGKKRFISTIEPLHYGAGNSEIDTTWTATTGAWQYQILTNSFRLYSRNVLNAGDTIQWLDPLSGQSVTLQPLALNWVNQDDSRQQITQPQAVTATVDDCRLTWTNGYGTGRHFRYTAHPTRLVKEFIIDAAANLPAPAAWLTGTLYLEVEFILKRSAGVTLYVDGSAGNNSTKTTTAQAIEFRTSTGQTVWQFDAPRATDAAGNSTPGLLQLRKQGSTSYVTVRFPRAWVQSATYPITLDPTLTDGYGGDVATSKDTYIVESDPNTNNGTNTQLQPHNYAVGNTRNVLIQFDVSSLSSVTVDSATLTLRYLSGTGTYYSLGIYRLLASWTENGATWNSRNGTNDWSTAGAQGSGTDRAASPTQTVAINGGDLVFDDLADDVQAWVDGAANNGWVIDPTTAPNSAYYNYWSSDASNGNDRPKLVIEYTEGGGDTTVSLDTAAITAAGQVVTRVPGAVALALDAAALTASGQVVTASPGTIPPTTVSLTAAAVAASGPDLTAIPGAVSVALDAAAVSTSGQALTSVPGAVAVALSIAEISTAGQGLTSAPGVVSVSLAAASLTAAGAALSVTPGAVTISLAAAAVAASGPDAAATPGAVSISLAAAAITTSGPDVTVNAPAPGAVTVSLTAAALAASGLTSTVVPGAVAVNLDAGSISAAGLAVAADPGVIPPTVIGMAAAAIAAGGQPLAITPGAVAVSLAVALVIAAARPASIEVAGIDACEVYLWREREAGLFLIERREARVVLSEIHLSPCDE